MSVYRRKYTVKHPKTGEKITRLARRYTIELVHPATGQIVRRKGLKDRQASKALETQLFKELERGMAGLGDPYKDMRAKDIRDVIESFCAKLESEHCDEMYVYTTRKRLLRLAMEAGWKTIFDATQRSFEEWRERTKKSGRNGKPTKPRTLNQFLATANEFFEWCIDSDRMNSNPLRKVKKGREVHDDNYRRPATRDELAKLLIALPSEDLRRFYLFALYTGLRRDSLEHLQWRDFHFGDDPAVTVRAESNKTRKSQQFPLRADVATMMQSARGGAGERALVFPNVPTIDEHRQYLSDAGIPFDDGHGGGRLDLHAFRKTLHTWMEDAGVDVREASKALGHLHLTTTLKSYRANRPGKREAGVEQLPSLINNAATNGKAAS